MNCEHCGGDITAQVALSSINERAALLLEHLGHAAKARVIEPLIAQLRRALARRFRSQAKIYEARGSIVDFYFTGRGIRNTGAFRATFDSTVNKAYEGGTEHVARSLDVLTASFATSYEVHGGTMLSEAGKLMTRRQPDGYDRTAQQLEDEIDATTRDRIAYLDATGAGAMLTAAAIATAIRQQFKQWATDRAQTIATHEVSRAFHAGGAAVARIVYEEGTHVQKHWDTQDNPCELCQENEDAGWMGEDEQYPNFPEGPPGHVGCVCSESYRTAGAEA